jgi:hypothetical protein
METLLTPVINSPVTYLGLDIAFYPNDRYPNEGDDVMQAWKDETPFRYVGYYLAPAPNRKECNIDTEDYKPPAVRWMGKRGILKEMGWGFLVTYVGYQEYDGHLGVLNEQMGHDNAIQAASLTDSEGFPNSTVIFLDVEGGGALQANMMSYIRSWVHTINYETQFRAGVYCSSDRAMYIRGEVPENDSIRFWVSNPDASTSPKCAVSWLAPDPRDSGFSGATVWQYAISPHWQDPGSDSGYTSRIVWRDLNENGIEDSNEHVPAWYCHLSYGGYALDVDLNTSFSPNPSNG